MKQYNSKGSAEQISPYTYALLPTEHHRLLSKEYPSTWNVKKKLFSNNKLYRSTFLHLTKVFFTVSPIVLVTNQLIASQLGSSVILECQTEANPLANTYWMLNNDFITSNTKYNIRTTSNSYRTYTKLEIRNLTKNDFGEYRCLSKNALGETEGTVRLYGNPSPYLLYKVIFHLINNEFARLITEYITSTTTETITQITTIQPTLLHRGTYSLLNLPCIVLQ